MAALLAIGSSGCTDDSDSSTTTQILTADELPVYVATVDIPVGTEALVALDAGQLESATATRAQFPENAIVNIELIADAESLEPIAAGTVITADMFIPRP
jgi:flagella basal body P-ring formation protein FlgA